MNAFDVTLFLLSGLESASQFHLAEVHARGLLEERDIVVATETAQTQRPRTVQQRQQQGLTTISLEEQKILLSLDRLNYQLQSKHLEKADCFGPELINYIVVLYKAENE